MEKYVLITGASSGLGEQTAVRLAQKGIKVFAGVRKEKDKDKLNSLHKNITAVFLDVTDSSSIEQAYKEISEKTKVLSALINNAGIALAGPVEFLPVDMLKKQFDVNVFGAIAVTQKFLPLMDKNNAKIINLSSMASYGIFPFVSPYCASKRALDMFFNSLLLETKNKNLKIVSIKPGVVSTPIWNKSVDTAEKIFENVTQDCKDKYEKELLFLADNARKNTNRGLQPEKIANLIAKILDAKNPKLSYNIGKDSFFAKYMSMLPLNVSNFLVKTGIKLRIK